MIIEAIFSSTPLLTGRDTSKESEYDVCDNQLGGHMQKSGSQGRQ
jgi:hypothetical protein